MMENAIEKKEPSLNPLKRVKFISIGNNFRWQYQSCIQSQSPQTGQVYFNRMNEKRYYRSNESQSPQTGQVYFNTK